MIDEPSRLRRVVGLAVPPFCGYWLMEIPLEYSDGTIGTTPLHLLLFWATCAVVLGYYTTAGIWYTGRSEN